MAKGIPKDWTLEELQFIWEYDGSDGSTITAHSARMGIKPATWYMIRAQLIAAGSPEELFKKKEHSKKHRYNRASEGNKRPNYKRKETLDDSVARRYTIRLSKAGRGDQIQYTVTIPPILGKIMVELAHNREVQWVVKPNGILLVPVKEKE